MNQLFRPTSALYCLVLAASVVTPTVTSSEPSPEAAEHAPSSGDSRLDRRVSLDAIGIELSSVLDMLGDQTIRFSANRECSSLKLHIRLKNRTVRQVMAALAELVPGTWIANDSSTVYRLEMAHPNVALRTRWWNLVLSERSRAFAAQREHMLAAMSPPPKAPRPPSDSDEPSDPFAERAAAEVRRWYGMLPRDLQRKIAESLPETAFYRAEGPFFANPYPREGAITVPFRNLPAEARGVIAAIHPKSDLGRSSVQFSNSGHAINPMLYFGDGKRTGLPLMLVVGPAPGSESVGFNHAHLARLLPHYGEKVPSSWKEFARFQERKVWNNNEPSRKPTQYPPPRRSDVLRWLTIQAGAELVADYYSLPGNPMRPSDKARALSGSIAKELDYRAFEQDMSWKLNKEGIFLVRNNRWYRDDVLEVDSGTIAALLKLRPKAGNPGAGADPFSVQAPHLLRPYLDWKAEIVKRVTLWQLANGLMHYVPESANSDADWPTSAPAPPPFRLLAEQMLSEYHTVKFYASLDPLDRAASLRGELRVMSLTREQQRAALLLCPEVQTMSTANSFLRVGFEKPYGFGILGDGPQSSDTPLFQLTLIALSRN